MYRPRINFIVLVVALRVKPGLSLAVEVSWVLLEVLPHFLVLVQAYSLLSFFFEGRPIRINDPLRRDILSLTTLFFPEIHQPFFFNHLDSMQGIVYNESFFEGTFDFALPSIISLLDDSCYRVYSECFFFSLYLRSLDWLDLSSRYFLRVFSLQERGQGAQVQLHSICTAGWHQLRSTRSVLLLTWICYLCCFCSC